jgi:hypothetical protein
MTLPLNASLRDPALVAEQDLFASLGTMTEGEVRVTTGGRVSASKGRETGFRTALSHVEVYSSAQLRLERLELRIRNRWPVVCERDVARGAQNSVAHGAQSIERPCEEAIHVGERDLKTHLPRDIGEQNEVDRVFAIAPACVSHPEGYVAGSTED